MLKLSRVNRDSRFDLPTPVDVHFQQHSMRRPRSTGQSSERVSGPSGRTAIGSIREAAASAFRLSALRLASPESPTSTILNRWSNAVPVAGVAMAAGRCAVGRPASGSDQTADAVGTSGERRSDVDGVQQVVTARPRQRLQSDRSYGQPRLRHTSVDRGEPTAATGTKRPATVQPQTASSTGASSGTHTCTQSCSSTASHHSLSPPATALSSCTALHCTGAATTNERADAHGGARHSGTTTNKLPVRIYIQTKYECIGLWHHN